MVNLSIRRKRSGVPVLSRREIDCIGERFVADFYPDALKEPQDLDVDSFAQNYLGMGLDYQYLSHCGVYLGMTVFNDTNALPVYNPAEQKAEYISARANTIIIDNSLLDASQEHRYRFTVGHECAHGILHGPYFRYDPRQLSWYDDSSVAMIQCRTDFGKTEKKNKKYWTEKDRMEWQANAFSSAVLMPKSMVLRVAEKIRRQYPGPEYETECAYCLAQETSDAFNVSFESATYRLKDLGVLSREIQLVPSVLNFIDVSKDEVS